MFRANDGCWFEENAGGDRRGRGRRDTKYRVLKQVDRKIRLNSCIEAVCVDCPTSRETSSRLFNVTIVFSNWMNIDRRNLSTCRRFLYFQLISKIYIHWQDVRERSQMARERWFAIGQS